MFLTTTGMAETPLIKLTTLYRKMSWRIAIIRRLPESSEFTLKGDSAFLAAFDKLLKVAQGVASIIADRKAPAHQFAQNAHGKRGRNNMSTLLQTQGALQ